jgi:hypothetical protein
MDGEGEGEVEGWVLLGSWALGLMSSWAPGLLGVEPGNDVAKRSILSGG